MNFQLAHFQSHTFPFSINSFTCFVFRFVTHYHINCSLESSSTLNEQTAISNSVFSLLSWIFTFAEFSFLFSPSPVFYKSIRVPVNKALIHSIVIFQCLDYLQTLINSTQIKMHRIDSYNFLYMLTNDLALSSL